MAWYNKYRPQTFQDVIGQDLIKKVFINALKTNKIKHAYLLSGPKGVGKTTTARIFANNLNQIDQNPEAKIDIIELDAASNTGIDNIRQLIESAQNPPISGKYKVYIIDEVHMLSKAAMNALLKILEEPPTYLVFILATTNPEKILPTVMSRLTSLSLTSHTLSDLAKRLEFIAKEEGMEIDQPSLKLIAKRAGGSQRDAINLLETLSSFNLDSYTQKDTASLLGMVNQEVFINLAQALLTSNLSTELLTELESQTLEAENFLSQFLEFLIDQSFTENSQFDALILPVSEVLSLKLPTGSIISLIAILKTKINPPSIPVGFSSPTSFSKPEINPNQNTDSSNSYNQKSNSKTTENEAPSQNKTQSEIEKSHENIENSQLEPEPKEEVKKEVKNPAQQTSSSKNPTELQFFLKQNLKGNPIFKMISDDLGVEEIKPGEVVLSVSNGIFLGQLKKGKLNQQLSEAASKFLGNSVKIEATQRNSKSPKIESAPISTASNPDELDEIQEMNQELNKLENEKQSQNDFQPIEENKIPEVVQEKNQTEENQEQQEKPTNLNQQEKGDFKPETKIFYKVYDKLPENMENSGVKVFAKKDLTPPTNINKESDNTKPDTEKTDQDWDKELEEMFEFE